MAIKLTNISKKYRIYETPKHKLKEALLRSLLRSSGWTYHREFWALRGVSLDVSRGETFGILGRNGSGKSTLLQVISGILQPTSGEVAVEGRVSALLELGAGFNRDFTGRENVFMNGAILGIPRREMEKRFKEIEAFAEIGAFIDQPVRIYSSGMYVRLAFATAVNVDPDVLIIDEALSVGDEIFRRRCYKKIEEFQKSGKTILFVSHNLQTVKMLCSRAMLLDEGRVLEVGSPNEIVHVYNDLIAKKEAFPVTVATSSPAVQQPLDGEDGGMEYRYGSGTAEIAGFEVVDREGTPAFVLEFGGNYTVRVRAHFHQDIENPEVGMRFTTLQGVAVSGTSTRIEGMSIGPARAGDDIDVEFRFSMRLKPETYTLSVGVSEITPGGEIVPLDRRMDAMILKVVGDKRPLGLVDMGFDIALPGRTSPRQGSLL